LAGSNVGDWQPALSSGQNFINQGGALAGQAANLTNQAAQPIGASQINNFLNPYTNDVVSALQQQSNTNFQQNVLPSIQSQFVSAGQAASPQQMQADNNALLAQQQALNPAVSQALQTGFQGALGAAQQQQQEQMAGAGQLGNLASLEGSLGSQQGQMGALQSQLGSFDVANLAASGQQQDTLSQENINASINNFNQQQQYPYSQLGFVSNLLHGLPVGSTSQTATETFPSAFGASPFSTAVGTALGAQSLGIGAAKGGHVRRGALQGYAEGGRSLVRTASYGDYGTNLEPEDWWQALRAHRAGNPRDPHDPEAEKDVDAMRRDITESQMYPDTERRMARGGALQGYAEGGSTSSDDAMVGARLAASQPNASLPALHRQLAESYGMTPGPKSKAYWASWQHDLDAAKNAPLSGRQPTADDVAAAVSNLPSSFYAGPSADDARAQLGKPLGYARGGYRRTPALSPGYRRAA
jgi:hypothetical protein